MRIMPMKSRTELGKGCIVALIRLSPSHVSVTSVGISDICLSKTLLPTGLYLAKHFKTISSDFVLLISFLMLALTATQSSSTFYSSQDKNYV